MSDLELHPDFFWRQDQTPDANFYVQLRFVTHIDQTTIDALTGFYDEFIPDGADVLDLMSSWVSHLPEHKPLGRVSGLGMNDAELAANRRLSDYCVHNLNDEPALPYEPASFDRVLIAVSIQYLIRPMEVMTSVARVLRPGGRICIAMSHRLFPTKAILAFHQASRDQRAQLVAHFCTEGGLANVGFIDRSPDTGDPLWLVVAENAGTAP